MAALGAAAGAFEGDNAREEQRARRAGLGLQAASLAQQDRQFVDRQTLEREQMALEQQRFQGNQDIAAQRTAIEQRNTDRSLTLDEKKFQAGQESDLYQRGREQKQDAWKSALDEETLRNKQMEYQTNEQLFQEAAKQRQIDDEKMANRKKIVQSAMGVAIRAIAESPNNVLSPSQIEYIKKLDPETYGNLVGGYGAGVGKPAALTFKDPKTGEARDEVIDPDKQFMIYDTVYGKDVANKLTGRQEQEAQNAFNLKRDEARYNSQLERDTLKAGNIVDPLKKIRYSGLQRQQDKIISELAEIDPADTEGYATKQALLDKIEAHMVALEGSGSSAPKPVEGEKTKYGLSKPVTGASSSASQVDPNMKALADKAMKDAGGDKAKAFQLFTQYKSELTGQEQAIQPEPVMKPYRSVYGPRAGIDNGKTAGYGPERGSVEYFRDMPTGKVTGMSKSDISKRRKEILNRLEQAYRKGPVARKEADQIKAELDAFNTQYRP